MKKIFGICLVALSLLACAQQRQARNPEVRTGGDGRLPGPGGPILNGVGGRDWGWITGASDFEQRVRLFASTTFLEGEIGSVTGGNLGVYFQGNVQLNGVNLLNVQSQTPVTATSSSVVVQIFDSYAAEGKGAINLEVGSTTGGTASGTVMRTGQEFNADVTFSDQLGWVKFAGTIRYENGSTANDLVFRGRVSFQNNCKYVPGPDGSEGRCDSTAGSVPQTDLGEFAVKACGFFQCQ